MLGCCGLWKSSRGEEVRIKRRDGAVDEVRYLRDLQLSVLISGHTGDLARVIMDSVVALRGWLMVDGQVPGKTTEWQAMTRQKEASPLEFPRVCLGALLRAVNQHVSSFCSPRDAISG